MGHASTISGTLIAAMYCKRHPKNGDDLSNMLPALSVYMGHESLIATSQYLKMTAEIYPEILKAVEETCSYAIPKVQ